MWVLAILVTCVQVCHSNVCPSNYNQPQCGHAVASSVNSAGNTFMAVACNNKVCIMKREPTWTTFSPVIQYNLAGFAGTTSRHHLGMDGDVVVVGQPSLGQGVVLRPPYTVAENLIPTNPPINGGRAGYSAAISGDLWTSDLWQCAACSNMQSLMCVDDIATDMSTLEIKDVGEAAETMQVSEVAETEEGGLEEFDGITEDLDVAGGLVEQTAAENVIAGAHAIPALHVRLWPLATHLFFEVGDIQFYGLAFCIMYVLDEPDYMTAGACICAVFMFSYLFIVFVVCLYFGGHVQADRIAREEGERYIECYDHKSKRVFYHNIDTGESVWDKPKECSLRTDGMSPIPMEQRLGLEYLFADYHCSNLISRMYPAIQLAEAFLQITMVTQRHFKQTPESAWMIATFSVLVATISTAGRPYIDESESQRDVVNWSHALSLWLMAAALLILAVDIQTPEEDESLELTFTVLSLLAMLVGPIACWIDELVQPTDEPEDSADGKPVEDISVEDNPLDGKTCVEEHGQEIELKHDPGSYFTFPEGWWFDRHTVVTDKPQKSEIDVEGDNQPQQLSKRERRAIGQQKLQVLREKRNNGVISELEYRSQKQELKSEVSALRSDDKNRVGNEGQQKDKANEWQKKDKKRLDQSLDIAKGYAGRDWVCQSIPIATLDDESGQERLEVISL